MPYTPITERIVPSPGKKSQQHRSQPRVHGLIAHVCLHRPHFAERNILIERFHLSGNSGHNALGIYRSAHDKILEAEVQGRLLAEQRYDLRIRRLGDTIVHKIPD
jgi:glycine/D-amino acid oxidase-like deaminating enzyme